MVCADRLPSEVHGRETGGEKQTDFIVKKHGKHASAQ